MQHRKRLLALGLLAASLQLTACGQPQTAAATKVEPAQVEAIEGTELNTVVLVAEAATRLDIQTAAVRDEKVTRKRIVGGEVEAAEAGIQVRVALSPGELTKVDRSQAAAILPLADTEAEASGVTAKPVELAASGDPKAGALYFAIEGARHGLAPGQRVRVELVLAGSGTQRKVVPYSSVIYDLTGATWVYTSPKDLTFVRERITVDYIDGDLAILSQGPDTGTQVVAVGAAELFGTEFGVGH